MKTIFYKIVKTTTTNNSISSIDVLYNFNTKTEAIKRLNEIKTRCMHKIIKDTKTGFACNYYNTYTVLNFKIEKYKIHC